MIFEDFGGFYMSETFELPEHKSKRPAFPWLSGYKLFLVLILDLILMLWKALLWWLRHVTVPYKLSYYYYYCEFVIIIKLALAYNVVLLTDSSGVHDLRLPHSL